MIMGDRKNKIDVEIECKTKGFDGALEEIDSLTDVLQNMPNQVVIRNCRDCVFNIYPSQTILWNDDADDDTDEDGEA